jgi:hypothetical protein
MSKLSDTPPYPNKNTTHCGDSFSVELLAFITAGSHISYEFVHYVYNGDYLFLRDNPDREIQVKEVLEWCNLNKQ